MAGSTFGKNFRITTWGESHGDGIGVVVDGVPAGIKLTRERIQEFLDKRKPGSSKFTTPRKENDQVKILSGVFEGKTTGTPISLLVENKDHNSKDYSEIKDVYRPGHADFSYDLKYEFRDYRGGGRSSGRETIGRVAAGAIASAILEELGVELITYTKAIGNIEIGNDLYVDKESTYSNDLNMPDGYAYEKAIAYLEKCMNEKDSSGSVVECVIHNMIPGLGEPVFDKLDAAFAGALMSIGAVKAVEIDNGINQSKLRGSENNKNAGGILGGISNGSEITLTAYFKPTPSIAREQDAYDVHGDPCKIEIKGRHDPVIGPRACIVVESMVAITIVDMLMQNMPATFNNIVNFYKH